MPKVRLSWQLNKKDSSKNWNILTFGNPFSGLMVITLVLASCWNLLICFNPTIRAPSLFLRWAIQWDVFGDSTDQWIFIPFCHIPGGGATRGFCWTLTVAPVLSHICRGEGGCSFFMGIKSSEFGLSDISVWRDVYYGGKRRAPNHAHTFDRSTVRNILV